MATGNNEIGIALTRGLHSNPELHRFGDAFYLPEKPSASLAGDTADAGESDTPARSDHRHEREPAADTDPAPVGVISMFAGVTPPTGWLICDGSAVSRTTYTDLFTRIGTRFGVGNGTSTFNVPDLKDRFPVGVSGTKLLASSGGADSVNISGATNVSTAKVGVQSGTDEEVSVSTHTHDFGPLSVSTVPSFLAVNYIIKASNE